MTAYKKMYSKELQLAIQAVKKSEKTFRKYFGTKTKVAMKGNNYLDLVSYADKKIEKDIKHFLLKKFPNYGFIGEEYGVTNGQAKFVWALDPVDGTSNYLQGLPECAISLALLKNEKPTLGVVAAPYLNKLYSATIGNGAKINGKSIKASKISDLRMSFGSIGWGRDIPFALKTLPKILPKVRKFRVPGCAALGMCFVAEGTYDFWLAHDMKIWDYAAAQVILEEAGGKLLISKKPRLQIAANKILAKKLQRLLSSS